MREINIKEMQFVETMSHNEVQFYDTKIYWMDFGLNNEISFSNWHWNSTLELLITSYAISVPLLMGVNKLDNFSVKLLIQGLLYLISPDLTFFNLIIL